MAPFFSCNGFFHLQNQDGYVRRMLHRALRTRRLPSLFSPIMSKPKRPVVKNKDGSSSRTQSDLPLRSADSASLSKEMEMDEEDIVALQEELSRGILPEDTAVFPQSDSPPEGDKSGMDGGDGDVQAPPAKGRRRSTQELPSVQRPPNPRLDLIGKIALWGLLPLIFTCVFYTILKNRPTSESRTFKPKPGMPIKGNLVQISEISSGWRARSEKDRVSPEIQAITKTQVFPSHLPVLKLKIASESQNGFLRVLFFNSEGKIAGDARVIKIVQGRVETTSAGEEITSDRECIVSGSNGLQSANHLTDYLAGGQVRWSVEISESSDYQARGEQWQLLESFALADTKF